MNHSNKTFYLIAGVLIALLVLLFALKPPRHSIEMPEQFNNAILSKPKAIQAFHLTNHDGKRFDETMLKGKWTLAFFGYTHCPDICPNTLTTLKGVAKRLQTDDSLHAPVQYLFISVDPKRDTSEHLKGYLEFFGPQFTGLTGNKEQIDLLARQMGVIYVLDDDTDSDSYIVNHSATIILVDPQGRLFAHLTPPHRIGDMVDTFRRLSSFYSD